MRHRRRGVLVAKAATLVALLFAVAAAAGCGFDGVASLEATDPGPHGGLGGDDAAVYDGGAPSDGASPETDAIADAQDEPLVDGGDAGVLQPYVYAHSATELYRLEPATMVFTDIGPLSGCGMLSDIAVDGAGKIVGIGDGLYAIDPTTGACSRLATPSTPVFTLTFVQPSGPVPSTTGDMLAAFVDGSYDRVNQATAQLTSITSGALDPYVPSGDLVSAGSGTYVSVFGKDNGGGGPDCTSFDCIFEVSPADGHVMNRYPTALTAIYGLAEWGGKLYAFTGSGDAYEMTLGTPVIAVPIPIVSKPLNGFVGAGSSTRVPLVPR